MREKPISFTGEMVNAVQEDRKTQTRRLLNPQPVKDGIALIDQLSLQYNGEKVGPYVTWLKNSDGGHDYDYNPEVWKCPYGAVGDQLWVREGYQVEEFCIPDHWMGGTYTSDNSKFRCNVSESDIDKLSKRKAPLRKSPGRFMYKSLSRIILEVTGIRVERIQHISDEDAIAEGISEVTSAEYGPTYDFLLLWESIHGKGSWARNDWIWVVEFKRIEP